MFNHYLTARISDGVLHRVLSGDVMAKWPFGGMFVATDLEAEQRRFDAREIIPAGPIYGRKMFASAAEASAREARTLEDAGLTPAAFNGFGKLLSGTRRYTLVYVDDLTGAVEPDGVRLAFTLPSGSYATVLVRELTHLDAAGGEEAD
ncbi:MAG: tRNA pseudouridine(13) synthase TruD [Gemmataceae bacterium]